MNEKCQIAFLGSDEIAIPFLEVLKDLFPGVGLCAVLTQPDRPAGRGRKLRQNPIKRWALANKLPLRDPPKPGLDEVNWLSELQVDLLLVMAYGCILKTEMLQVAPRGCFNLHASILPAYRGASPIETALACGERETGVTLMRVVPKMDAGPIIDSETVKIGKNMLGPELREDISQACIPLLERNLMLMLSGTHREIPQIDDAATYCRKLSKQDGMLDFSQQAETLDCRIRAFVSWPGSSFFHGDNRLRVGKASLSENDHNLDIGEVGRPSSGTLLIGTSAGSLRIEQIQKPGGKMLATAEFLRGYDLQAGTMLMSDNAASLLLQR
tara:strand:- start:189 stop:1166 length:978 start_codon:yes stop_codon:yes gene_type:complete